MLLHFDADAFFASCEQALHPEYRGKPVITGQERGIVAAASYEAKKLGIKRGVSLLEVPRICPEAIIVPSDYETYSLFSRRMFGIIRRYTPAVEEYSIDEAFADIQGLRRPLKMSYSEIACRIKFEIENELGITVSVGMAPTKVLAKVASKWQKPAGLTAIRFSQIPAFLKDLPTQEVWGIGSQTASFLAKNKIRTAYEFIQKPFEWVEKNLTKPHQEIWQELRGESVYAVEPEPKDGYASISKTKTFKPVSKDPSFVLAQLCKNVENAFIKARRYNLATRKIVVCLKEHNQQGYFKSYGLEGQLSRATAYPPEAMPVVRQMFQRLFKTNTLYRATGVILIDLQDRGKAQLDLFEDPLKLEKIEKIYQSLDELDHIYGKHTVCLGTTLPALTNSRSLRTAVPWQKVRYKKVDQRKFLGMPMLGS